MVDLSLFSLEGKVALVTGGSRGIGEATAMGFAKAGADVIVSSRKQADLEVVVDKIKKLGRKSLAVAAHIGKMDDVKNLVDTVKDKFGKVDILVNNAGTSPVIVPFLENEEKLWDSIMNLNLKGMYFLSIGIGKMMKENGGGSIINVSSVDGYWPEYGTGIYAISKAGVLQMTRMMARELADFNIRVNSVAPGFVHTKLMDSKLDFLKGEEERLVNNIIPMKRLAQPEEMVGAMIYLASNASSYMTGHCLLVDGGVIPCI